MATKTKVSRDIRVVKKTRYDHRAKKSQEWYEVQYSTWVPFRTYNGAIKFADKSHAMDFALRKKAGVSTNGTETEVIA